MSRNFLYLSFLLYSLNGQACITTSEKSFSEVDTTTKKEAELYTQVCGLLGYDSMTLLPTWQATGTLVHRGDEKFYVLTSAHDFYDEEMSKIKTIRVKAQFKPKLELISTSDSFVATRFFIPESLKKNVQGHGVHDIAVIEFSGVESLSEDIQPLPLYNGTGYKKPHIASCFVGYGEFGLNTSGTLTNSFDRRLGYTNISYTSWRGHESFHHWLCGLDDLTSFTTNPRQWRFDPKMTAEILYGSDPICVMPHKNQALFGDGGSGSSLLFKTKDGNKIAGVASQTMAEVLPLLKSLGRPLIVQAFEPVMPWVEWIQTIVTGEIPEKTKVVVL